MRDGESLNQKKPWPLSSALRPFCSAKLAVVGRYLHTDRGEYQKAAHFWDLKAKCGGKEEISIPEIDVVNLGLSDEASLQISIQNYIDLFAGREDTYTKEILKKAATYWLPPPYTDSKITLLQNIRRIKNA